ncbi:MAG: hypothetical protein QHH15_07475 [Candidatus Thermoplasmatota archaeon]|jgi:hypothetical protein|nr:hypothetical protein [Candidatus Thermoplasmatota archaeon]
MDKKKLFAGILLFGSLWGFSESIIGSALSDFGLPSGAIMTSLFALSFLVVSRIYYKQPGMQLGMGIIAGTLKLFNPFTGCHLCSALAIVSEAAIFEILWYKISFDLKELKTITMQISTGILTSYIVFVGGYIVTQILTPIISGLGFYLENLIVLLPNIFSDGLLPALIGGAVLPVIILVKKVDFAIKDHLYYPTTIGVSILCWFIVIGNWFLLKI